MRSISASTRQSVAGSDVRTRGRDVGHARRRPGARPLKPQRDPSRPTCPDDPGFAPAAAFDRPAAYARYGVTVIVPFMPCAAWPSTGQMNVYVPAARVVEIVSVVPGWNARSFVARLTPVPLMIRA